MVINVSWYVPFAKDGKAAISSSIKRRVRKASTRDWFNYYIAQVSTEKRELLGYIPDSQSDTR